MTRTAGLPVMALAIFLALAPAPARTQQPTFSVDEFTAIDPDLSEECGFPVEVHVQGKRIDMQHADTTTTIFVSYTITFTNLSNGKSFTMRRLGPFRTTETTVDGVTTFVFSHSGVDTLAAVPGEGVASQEAGQVIDIFVVDFNTDPPTLISSEHVEHGNTGGRLSHDVICSLLS